MADMTTSTANKDRSEVARPEMTRGGLYFTPRVDIYETDKELTLYAELPGVQPSDVDLHYEQGELVLQGRLRPRPAGGRRNVLWQEYEEGDFYRAFTISESIDASRIEAECKNGALVVHLPKAESARPRQIQVRGQ
jgi:HSP20 family protein